MGFSFKVAPGVRIRASSRGVRASVGPRIARVHVGAGRTGFSTGVGPVSLYRSTGGGSGHSRSTSPARSSVAAQERQLRQAQKTQQAAELRAAFEAIESLHRQEFRPASAPLAPAPAPVDEAAIRQWHEGRALQGLGVLQRQARAAAREQAAAWAAHDINEAVMRGRQQHAQAQQELNEQWRALLGNEPDIVFATLTEAFEDNQAPVAVTGVENGEASVLVMVPGIDAVPERMPKLTAAGNLSIAKMTKTQRNSFYLSLVCGHVLITVREALAVAPGLHAVRVAVVRQASPDAYGARATECLLAALFSRHRLTGVRWDSASSAQIVQDTSADLRVRLSGTGEPLPLDLTAEPALAALLQVIDISEEETQDAADSPHDDIPAWPAQSQQPSAAAGYYPPASPHAGREPEPTAVLPSPMPTQPGRPPRRRRSKRRTALLITLGCLVALIIIGVASNHDPKTTPASNPTPIATTSPAHSASAAKPHATKKKPRPKKTPSHAATTHAPAPTSAPAVAPSSQAAATPTGCHPLTNGGNCYEPGEYCRNSDHGVSGIAGDGEAITCEDNDGWRWEPS